MRAIAAASVLTAMLALAGCAGASPAPVKRDLATCATMHPLIGVLLLDRELGRGVLYWQDVTGGRGRAGGHHADGQRLPGAPLGEDYFHNTAGQHAVPTFQALVLHGPQVQVVRHILTDVHEPGLFPGPRVSDR